MNYGDIYVSGTGDICVGGISMGSRADSGAYIISCCNYGKISCVGLDHGTDGGADLNGICIGFADGGDYDSVNCYNAGMISVGVGDNWAYGIGHGFNVYSVGTVSAASNGSAAALSILCDNRTLGKGYWLSGTAPAGIEIWEELSPEERAQIDTSSIYECTKSKMKSQAFVDELNANSRAAGYGEVWERDTEGFNHGYPILKNVPYDKSFYWDDAEGGEEEEEPSETGITNLFQNDKYTYPVKADSIIVYANGGAVTKDGKKTNFKSKAIYTDILASYKYWTDTKGKYQTATGKVIVGITKTNEKSKLSFNKKGNIVDAAAAKIASASIKNGRITVTAKSEAGKVYLWVLDTGDAGKYTCCPVTVKMAPTTLETYAISDTDASFKYGTTKKYTKENIDITDSVDVYVYPYYKESGVAKKTADATYSAEVESKIDGCFTVTKSGANKFTVKATGLKTGTAKTTGNVIIKCDQNGKKVNFNVTALNHVRKAVLGNADKVTLDAATNEITIAPSDSGKVTGTVKVQMTKSLSTKDTTDAAKVYAMQTADGYDTAKFAEGAVNITKKPTALQKKLTASLGSDKQTLTVSAAKGTPAGQTAYFLLVYNTSDLSDKKGYLVFSVKTE